MICTTRHTYKPIPPSHSFMKHLLCLFCALLCSLSTLAQTETEESGNPLPATMRYGYCSRSQIVQSQAEYVLAMQQLVTLRQQYEREAEYNETDFRRQYSEYLNGQKDFPQAILLKRQRDLQDSMEKGLAFRTEADSLLQQAEKDLLAPIYSRIDRAIQAVGAEQGYDYVIDTDLGAFLWLNPALSEDITSLVEEKLKAL